MINWSNFIWFGFASIILWWVGALWALKGPKIGSIIYGCGVLVFMTFVALFWMSMGRAPLRTMGETRLWYSLFLSLVSLLLYLRWHYKFLLPFGALVATVFTLLNILKPEIHDATLMPALQSAWFFPHVTIYMLAYAVVAMALIICIVALCGHSELWKLTDQLVRIGSALILLGMLMGAVWAKQAWGNYWAWDAKENWAMATWLLYITYLHVRSRWQQRRWLAFGVLVLAFLALQVTWYGVNHLPAAKQSMHTYTMNTK